MQIPLPDFVSAGSYCFFFLPYKSKVPVLSKLLLYSWWSRKCCAQMAAEEANRDWTS